MAVVGLVVVVTGCGGSPRYDARLVAADSLMHDLPDSALALVQAVDTASLPREGDRAYHDLLLTQARYRCYITATTDSAINRALTYYRQHDGEREKLTRAYIYKGAVMEELGYPDSAMLYYKHAESTAAPDDYFNLGYTKMRMGALYRDNMEIGGKHIIKYEEALACLQKTDEKHYQLACMADLGGLYCLKYPQKGDSLLNAALLLAEQEKDTVIYVDVAQNLMKSHINQQDYEASHDVFQKVIEMGSSQYPVAFFIYTAMTFSHLNEPDSAKKYIDIVKEAPISNTIDSLAYLETLRDIALAHGDPVEVKVIDDQCKHLSDSLLSSEASIDILKTENEMIRRSEQESQMKNRASIKWRRIMYLLLGSMAVIAALFYGNLCLKKRQKRQIQRQLDSALAQIDELKQLQEKLRKYNINDNILKELLDTYMKMMNDVIEEIYRSGYSNSQKLKQVVQFRSAKEENWTKLFGYLDMEYSNIISQTKANYPNLSNKDLLLIAMVTLDFSYVQMAMILGYNNATTMSSMKQRLAKKMGLESTLNEYIKQYKSDRI